MATKPIRITFTLDEADARHFRGLYRGAKKHAREDDAPRIIREVKKLITKVREAERIPSFVDEAVRTLEDLIQMIEDRDYQMPKTVVRDAVAALSYFANPHDVIPDHVPGLGYLDDAIIMKFVEDEFKHELWAYRKFRGFRDGAEHRPWTKIARERLPRRLAEHRETLRSQVDARKAKERGKEEAESLQRSANTKRGAGRRRFGW